MKKTVLILLAFIFNIAFTQAQTLKYKAVNTNVLDSLSRTVDIRMPEFP